MSIDRWLAKRAVDCTVILLLTGCGQSTDDLTSESIQTLPDWSGWWVSDGDAGGNGLRDAIRNLDVYQPEARRIVEQASVPGANLGGGSLYCLPTRFNGGSNGWITESVEFLLMPERLTITNEDGMLRRIPIDGRSLRENPEPSNGGTSIGWWEGDTLIIETIGLHPDTTFPTPSRPNSPQIGENVHVLERLRLNEEDQMVIDTELTAPQMLVEPIKFTSVYHRDPDHIYRDHDRCSLNDRSIDPETGLERFDMTPPEDLPPPPPK